MPKLTDRPKQKQLIAEAAWRVILEKGVQKTSARNIAKEAGLSLGALRYYFDSQDDLIDYADRLVHARLAEKIDEIFQDDLQPKTKISKVLLCLLPIGGAQGMEAKVRVSMKFATVKQAGSADAAQDAAYSAAKNIVSYLALLNLLGKKADLALETERLFSLINGLAVDLLLHPEAMGEKKTENLIMYHLNSICIEKFGDVE
ncbi:TetR family transcriptional regulator [Planococcus sp. FY231025]|uniref:TetR family transcriptional regulator n=1 Tax=Planococcus sp. FY231025 TaxID=3455699 RepID=UPI003F8E26FB